MVITYPLLTVIDDAGAVVSGATVAITSVKDKAGTDVAGHGATLGQSGANVSVDYDADTKGEAWIVLAISKVGSTFTGLNAAPAFFLSRDPGRIATLDELVSVDTGTVASASTGTAFVATGARLNAVSGSYKAPQFIYFLTGACAGERRAIASHVVAGSNHTFTVAADDAFSATPQAGDTFLIG